MSTTTPNSLTQARFRHAMPPKRAAIPLSLAGFMTLALFVCGAAAWIFKPKYGTLGSPLIPLSPLQALLPLLGLGSFFYLLAACGVQFPRVMRVAWSTNIYKFGILLVLFGASFHLSSEGYAGEAALYLVRWLLPFLTVYIMYVARDQGVKFEWLLYGFIPGAIISILAVEADRMGIKVPVTLSGGRYGALLNHPNQYGIITSTTATVIIYLFWKQARFAKPAAIACLGIWFFTLYQSLSKTNILLFLLCIAGGYVLLSLQSPAKIIRSGLIIAGLFVALGVASVASFAVIAEVSPKNAAILEGAIFDPEGVKSLDDREGVWDDAIGHIKNHPLMGIGPGKSQTVLTHNHCHNLFLQHWVDAGLTGFIGICCIVFAIVMRMGEATLEAIRRARTLDEDCVIRILACLSITVYTMANLMSDSFNTATMTTYCLFAGIAFLIEKPAARQEEDEEDEDADENEASEEDEESEPAGQKA